ncbi:M81 family metallopeptidase [Henriciella sp. AS95]|uniref:M81 family metallopeptidase n=1 Tax=Henriciella sp. AS95 TaxID=3135782 RepID=UPI00317136EB
MRVFIGGIRTETNTFVARPTGERDFLNGDVTRAHAVHVDPGLHPGYAGFLAAAQERGDYLARGIIAYAVPGGAVEQSVYADLKETLLQDLRQALPVDMVLLDLHGAMVAEETIDCEGDLIDAVRAIVGNYTVIGVLIDPHAVLSQKMITSSDLLHAYKEYPHTDVMVRAGELYDASANMVATGRRPVCRVAELGLIGGFPTVSEPMAGFVRWMKEAESRPGIVSVSLIQSFPWSDSPDAGAKVLVYADNERLSADVAEEGAERFRAIFEQAVISTMPVADAVDTVVSHPEERFILADVSDNPGGGASGDATHLLQALIDANVRGIGLALLNDPQSLARAQELGLGGRGPFSLGGKLSPFSGAPLKATFRVAALSDGDGKDGQGAVGGPSSGPLALLEADFGVIVVGGERRQALSPSLFSVLGVDPRKLRILVIKSSAHFRAAFSDFSHQILEVGSPAEMNPDLPGLPFRRIRRPLWPFDPLPPIIIRAPEAL